jgi:hypothetical protein
MGHSQRLEIDDGGWGLIDSDRLGVCVSRRIRLQYQGASRSTSDCPASRSQSTISRPQSPIPNRQSNPQSAIPILN